MLGAPGGLATAWGLLPSLGAPGRLATTRGLLPSVGPLGTEGRNPIPHPTPAQSSHRSPTSRGSQSLPSDHTEASPLASPTLTTAPAPGPGSPKATPSEGSRESL